MWEVCFEVIGATKTQSVFFTNEDDAKLFYDSLENNRWVYRLFLVSPKD